MSAVAECWQNFLAENSATELQSTAKGLVHMVAPVSFGCQILVPGVERLHGAKPEVNVMLTLDNQTPNLVAGMRS